MSTVRCGTLVCDPLYDPGQKYDRAVLPQEFDAELRRELSEASTSVDRADRGNQPISRRVDTISKQYQAMRYPPSGKQDGSSYGGGAPWES